jgi:pimeloyl-ACP methyl ester carboxylesterase
MYLGERPDSKLWYPELKSTLEKHNCTVDVPIMPEAYFGSLTTQNISWRFNYVGAAFSWIPVHTIVGHSIGGSLALYAAQYMPFKRLILVAPYVPPTLDYEAISATLNYTQGEVVIVYEKNDPLIPYSMISYLISKFDQYKINYKLHEVPTNNHIRHLDVAKDIEPYLDFTN